MRSPASSASTHCWTAPSSTHDLEAYPGAVRQVADLCCKVGEKRTLLDGRYSPQANLFSGLRGEEGRVCSEELPRMQEIALALELNERMHLKRLQGLTGEGVWP